MPHVVDFRLDRYDVLVHGLRQRFLSRIEVANLDDEARGDTVNGGLIESASDASRRICRTWFGALSGSISIAILPIDVSIVRR